MINLNSWISNNYIELFGALTGIIYVFLEIRQNIWLWPVGIITSAVYILVFFSSKFYADMALQGYYLIISFIGWYWWGKGIGLRAQGSVRRAKVRMRKQETDYRLPYTEYLLPDTNEKPELQVTRLKMTTGLVLGTIFVLLYLLMWLILSKFTDSPVPEWDSFITSLSVIATWMLARKIYEHWYLWIIVNFVSVVLFVSRGLYPTVVLYMVYGIMSFAGLVEWKKTIRINLQRSKR